MMISSNIPSFLNRFFKSGKRVAAPSVMHPKREWITGLIGAFLLLALGSAYAGLFFWYQLTADEKVVADGATVIKYNEALIDEVLTEYRARADAFNALRSEAPFVSPNTVGESGETGTVSEESLSAE